MIEALKRYGIQPEVVDPWVDPREAQRDYGVSPIAKVPPETRFQAVVAVWLIESLSSSLRPIGETYWLQGVCTLISKV